MTEEDVQHYKIIFLGDQYVGKSSILNRFYQDKFEQDYQATIGLDFHSKNVEINNTTIRLLLYDTAGQEKFKSITLNYFKETEGIILMYDITNTSSFESIPGWIKSVKEYKGEDYPMILLGNKLDKNEERQINKEDGEQLAKENGIDFFEISNKDGINVEESCLALIKKIIYIIFD